LELSKLDRKESKQEKPTESIANKLQFGAKESGFK
jgi:hypothetical protein